MRMVPTASTVQKGRDAETTAVGFLRKKGWEIVGRNFRSRDAELDVIALDGETLVFLEVKQRSTHRAGLPEEAVGPTKIAKLYKAARYFLKRNPQHASRDCRFDVIALDGMGPAMQLRHVTNVACR